MATDYARNQAGAALGARLRRLSERIDSEAGRLYAEVGVEFEQRWFGVLNQLVLHGPSTVGRLASLLGISHVSVSQTRQSLEKAGLIALEADPEDGRSRLLHLTAAGRQLIADLEPLWNALAAVAQELNAEAGDTVAALDRLDDALNATSLTERVRKHLEGRGSAGGAARRSRR